MLQNAAWGHTNIYIENVKLRRTIYLSVPQCMYIYIHVHIVHYTSMKP